MEKHEYLKAEDFYETRSVGAGRSAKTCEFCGGTIGKGTGHDVHHFYPEFQSYPTHKKCTTDFMASLRTPEDDKQEEKVAKVVTFGFTVRIITTEGQSEAEVAQLAIKKVLNKPTEYITGAAVDDIKEDTDEPYDEDMDG
jgi:hypothetical protein